MVTQTHTDGGGPPLTEVQVGGEADLAPILGSTDGRNNTVHTSTDADESVIKGLVGLISATNDLAVLVAIVVLLSKSVCREQEACNSKSSENFDTFHNTILEIKLFIS